jgi:hypothetical protein
MVETAVQCNRQHRAEQMADWEGRVTVPGTITLHTVQYDARDVPVHATSTLFAFLVVLLCTNIYVQYQSGSFCDAVVIMTNIPWSYLTNAKKNDSDYLSD